MSEKLCKCGKKIFFAKDENGKTQVLDLVAPVYVCEGTDLNATGTVRRLPFAYVSHFATCSAADEFSRKKGKQA